MSGDSKIEWTDATWNPVTGCTKVSPGCDHCYAETIAERFRGTPGHHFEQGFDVVLRPERLDIPLRWRKPRKVFVNSMSDLFHDDIPDEFIARVFAVMALAPQHTFQILTKRHARMRSLLRDPKFIALVPYLAGLDYALVRNAAGKLAPRPRLDSSQLTDHWAPLPNVWLGVSVENQRWADIRIPALLDTPAAVRFLSCEPLVGPVDLSSWLDIQIDCGDPAATDGCPRPALGWVIVGGESGHGARPMHPDWARALRDQCTAAGVPFLFKQHGEWFPGSSPRGARPDAVVARDTGEWLAPPHRLWDEKTNTDAENRRGWAFVHRAGKKAAGRELDGRTWDEFPQVSSR